MKKMSFTLAMALPVLVACAGPLGAEEFEDAAIHLERNVTDDDAEAVIFVKTEESGLASLLIIAPTGRRIGRFDSNNRKSLGAREILLESPEPSPAAVLAAYPEGNYRIIGVTFDGEEMRARAELSHDFPDPAHVTFPAEGATVPAAGLVIEWDPVAGVEGYFLELEQEDLELVLEVNLPDTATSFSPPAGWLVAGSEYVLGIGTLGENGNRTFIESTFNVAE
ncbi:MAG TPA: hypothetical protein VN493_19065 [Thermoanaerobaculia bacterium]|nr:hypothetical protein [Thermoanaerobaculia bacterium]